LRLRQLNGYQFYRQRIIVNYIVDFYCPKAKLVVEVDGWRHFHGKTEAADQKRDEYLKKLGIKVLRYSDTDVLTNLSGVVENILDNLKANEK
jgi:very-short-patch-repair endonuclease